MPVQKRERPLSKQFEYVVTALGAADRVELEIQGQLNELGKDGWELVAIDAGTLYLKRAREWAPPA